MVKAKDFWDVLCNDLEYRFFSGVACPGLAPLYKTMSPKTMHYVPAANERIAIGMVSGAYLSGFKGALLTDGRFVKDIERVLSFNLSYKIPLLIISYGDNKIDKIHTSKLITIDDMIKLDKHYDNSLSPVQLVIEEGSIS